LATPPRKGDVADAQRTVRKHAACLRVRLEDAKTQRAPITLHELRGLSHAEIAEPMHESEGAVRSLVYCGPCRVR